MPLRETFKYACSVHLSLYEYKESGVFNEEFLSNGSIFKMNMVYFGDSSKSDISDMACLFHLDNLFALQLCNLGQEGERWKNSLLEWLSDEVSSVELVSMEAQSEPGQSHIITAR